MNNNVVYGVIPPASGRKFPANPPKAELERILQEGFRTRDKRVLDEYFIEGSEFYPTKLSLFIVPYLKDSAPRIWIGALVATDDDIEGFRFTYYDKITVLQPYQGNGVMKGMISVARKFYTDKAVLPSLLRTDDAGLDLMYGKQSDAKTYIGPWHVNGFGFKDKTTDEELFRDADKMFQIAAKRVASKPRTVVPIN